MKSIFKNKRIYQSLTLVFFSGLVLACQPSEEKPAGSSGAGGNLPENENNISVDSMNRQALVQWNQGNYKSAFDLTNKAYQAAKNSKDEKSLAKALNTLGLIYWRLENNESAMESYKASAKLAQKQGLLRLLGLSHTNQGLILKAQGDFDQAFLHNNKAIQIFKKGEFYRDLAIALNNQGQIFKNQGNIDSAQYFYRKAIGNYEKEDYKNGMAATYYNLSETYMREDRKKASLDAAYKSLELALATHSKVRLSEAYERLSTTYEYFHQPDSALKYYKLHGQQQKAILLDQQSKRLAKYQAKMGAELNELQIQNLKKEKELVANRFWFLLIGLGVLLLVGAFFVYRYFTRMRFKRRNLEIELKNSQKILTVKEKELKNYILDLSEKNLLIKKLQDGILKTKAKKSGPEVDRLLQQKILTNEDWDTFKEKFKAIYPDFFVHMRQFQAVLTESEVRFMVLFRLELSANEMAKILGISPQSVRVSKMRLKKKLKKEGFSSVEEFLQVLVA